MPWDSPCTKVEQEEVLPNLEVLPRPYLPFLPNAYRRTSAPNWHPIQKGAATPAGRWPGSRDGGAEDEGEDEEEGIDEEDEYKEDGYEADKGEDNEDDEDIKGGVVEGEQEDDDDGDGSVGHRSEDENQEENWFDNASSAVDELLELVFQLSITLSTEEFVDSQPSSSLLVYFSGILGFSPDTKASYPRENTPRISLPSFTSSGCYS
ncbi:hypothetical protein B0J14DRAFT_663163 [Halenospora varia]|nr:hypothetical protein B0J14DRAFT_663163 [Halenospora varia]